MGRGEWGHRGGGYVGDSFRAFIFALVCCQASENQSTERNLYGSYKKFLQKLKSFLIYKTVFQTFEINYKVPEGRQQNSFISKSIANSV